MKRSPISTSIPPERFTDLGQLSLSVHLHGYVAQMLSWGFFKPKWWRNFLHTHSFLEICYAYAGRGTFRILGVDHAVKAGDVFIAKPGEAHEIISDRRDPLGIYFWSYTLVRRSDVNRDASPIDRLLEAFMRSGRAVGCNVPGIHPTLQLLTEEVVHRSAGFPVVIQGLLTKLLLDTARAVVDEAVLPEQVEPLTGSESEATVRTVCRYIQDNLSRSITVRDMAAQVHVSERHLGRLFQQEIGVSVMNYVTRMRLKTAAQMLLDHRIPVKKIAAEVGYPDVHYFTTLFRKRKGITPVAFRKQRGTTFVNGNNGLPGAHRNIFAPTVMPK